MKEKKFWKAKLRVCYATMDIQATVLMATPMHLFNMIAPGKTRPKKWKPRSISSSKKLKELELRPAEFLPQVAFTMSIEEATLTSMISDRCQ